MQLKKIPNRAFEDVLFDPKQGNDDDRVRLVCHYQAMGGPEQSMCNCGYSWSGLSSPCELMVLFSEGGSHGGS